MVFSLAQSRGPANAFSPASTVDAHNMLQPVCLPLPPRPGVIVVYPEFPQWNGPHRNTLANHIYATKIAWKSQLCMVHATPPQSILLNLRMGGGG